MVSGTAQDESAIPLLLPEQEVHVWIADRAELTPLPRSLVGLLSLEEQQHAARFLRTADCDRFSIGRSLLRHTLGRYADLDPRGLAFRQAAQGKPSLEAGDCPVRFNVSHSGDIVLLAFALGHDVGVDVELIRADANIENLAESCFSEAERTAIFQDPDTARLRFFEYWAAKESWIKADGRGMTLPLCAYTLSPREADVFEVRSPNESGPLAWTVRPLPLRSGYACAVTTRPVVRTVRVFGVGADPSGRGISPPQIAVLRNGIR